VSGAIRLGTAMRRLQPTVCVSADAIGVGYNHPAIAVAKE
jgi:hypothetical protein